MISSFHPFDTTIESKESVDTHTKEMREQDKTNTSSEEETYTDSESDSESSPTSQQREETVFSTIEWESIEVHSFLSSSYSLFYSTTLLFFTFPTLGCMKKDL